MSDEIFDLIDRLDRIIEDRPAEGDDGSSDGPTETHPCWESFFEISALLNSARLDFEEVLRVILDVAIRATRSTRGFIILHDEERGLEVELARASEERSIEPDAFAYSRSVVLQTLDSGEPVYIPNIEDAESRFAKAESVQDLGLRSAICVPLMLTVDKRDARKEERRQNPHPSVDNVLGVIYVDSNAAVNPLKVPDINFLRALANQATATIINAKLYQQATTDALSGLYTRRQFEVLLDEAIKTWEQTNAPFALLMLDLDHFKQVNDRHGHLVGDEVIAELGTILKNCVRLEDASCRYGGEEFAVLLANTDARGGLRVAEKIRRRVAESTFSREELRISVSVGIAAFPEHSREDAELVKKADQALYLAKEDGRNICRVWTDSIEGSAKRKDRLAGIITGDFATDYNNVMLLLDTISAINSTMDLNKLLVLTVDKVIEATGAERGALMLIDEGEDLETVVCRDRNQQNLKLEEKFSQTIPQQVLNRGESICVVDTQQQSASQSVAELNLRTIMCVPLTTKEKSVGVIYVDSRTLSGDLQESNLPFFEALARQVAFAIENARLKARLAYEGGLHE